MKVIPRIGEIGNKIRPEAKLLDYKTLSRDKFTKESEHTIIFKRQVFQDGFLLLNLKVNQVEA